MYSPQRFADRIGNIGTPLPDPYKSLGAVAKAKFRRGAVSMIAGTPGSFKSVLALNILVRWAQQGITSLYFCADSDEFTVTKRLCGILTGENLDLIERRIIGGDRQRYVDVLTRELGGRAEFEYETMKYSAEIARHIKSYESVYGGYPDVVFVDNLTDFVSSPFAFDEMQELLGDFDGMSKEMQAHFFVLHHAKLPNGNQQQKNEEAKPRGWPPADWEIQGKVTQKPRLAITIAATGLAVKTAVVKNSLGPQDGDAETTYEFIVYNNMQMKDRMD